MARETRKRNDEVESEIETQVTQDIPPMDTPESPAIGSGFGIGMSVISKAGIILLFALIVILFLINIWQCRSFNEKNRRKNINQTRSFDFEDLTIEYAVKKPVETQSLQKIPNLN